MPFRSFYAMKHKKSVFIASADDYYLNKLSAIMSEQNDLQVIGTENNEIETIIKIERLKPDLVILDIQPEGMDVQELIPIIRRRSPSTLIIMLSERDENEYALRVLNAGISGFMLKNEDMDKLIHVIGIVIMGGIYISASIIKRVFGSFSLARQLGDQAGKEIDSDKNIFSFSATERRIILDIAQGYLDDEIASRLNISSGTVKNYLSVIKQKTKMKNRFQIVLFSLVNGFIKTDQLEIFKTDYC